MAAENLKKSLVGSMMPKTTMRVNRDTVEVAKEQTAAAILRTEGKEDESMYESVREEHYLDTQILDQSNHTILVN